MSVHGTLDTGFPHIPFNTFLILFYLQMGQRNPRHRVCLFDGLVTLHNEDILFQYLLNCMTYDHSIIKIHFLIAFTICCSILCSLHVLTSAQHPCYISVGLGQCRDATSRLGSCLRLLSETGLDCRHHEITFQCFFCVYQELSWL